MMGQAFVVCGVCKLSGICQLLLDQALSDLVLELDIDQVQLVLVDLVIDPDHLGELQQDLGYVWQEGDQCHSLG